MLLRPYQEAAKAALYGHLRARDDNPCAVIPTAGGKTPVIASVCKDAVTLWKGRVLVLAHIKELLLQTAQKLQVACPEVAKSRGINRREASDASVAKLAATSNGVPCHDVGVILCRTSALSCPSRVAYAFRT
jgi:superfamily II DNA or RNA helicase